MNIAERIGRYATGTQHHLPQHGVGVLGATTVISRDRIILLKSCERNGRLLCPRYVERVWVKYMQQMSQRDYPGKTKNVDAPFRTVHESTPVSNSVPFRRNSGASLRNLVWNETSDYGTIQVSTTALGFPFEVLRYDTFGSTNSHPAALALTFAHGPSKIWDSIFHCVIQAWSGRGPGAAAHDCACFCIAGHLFGVLTARLSEKLGDVDRWSDSDRVGDYPNLGLRY
jgi:hypothetical protein